MLIAVSTRVRLLCCIVFMVMVSLSGCGDTNNTTNNNDTYQDNRVLTLTGRVADAALFQGIGGAHVELAGTATTAVLAAVDAAPDGSFIVPSVAIGSYTMRVTASGYAVSEFRVSVSSTPAGTSAIKDIGYVLLGKPFDLTVVATDNGIPVAGVPVTALQSGSGQCGSYYGAAPIANSYSTMIVSSTTGTSGTAVLHGLSQCINYQIINGAFDSDGDGLYDYVAGSQYFGFLPAYDSTTVTIALVAAYPYWYTSPQQVIAANTRMTDPLLYYQRNITDAGDLTYAPSTDYHAIASHQPIRIVFRYPVTLSGALTVSYPENLADPDSDGNGSVDTGFPFETQVPVSASLDGTGTILTIAPPAAGFPANRLVKIRGSVSMVQNGFPQVEEIRNITDGPDIVYVADDGVSGLSPAGTITADNYNGGNGAAGTVYLEFPEYVTGSVRVISYIRAGIETIVNGATITDFGEMVFTDGGTTGLCSGKCGNGAGVFFRINTGQVLSDGDLIRVAVDVADIEGNRLSREQQLVVE